MGLLTKVVAFIRKWLYFMSIWFWLIGVLVPISMLAYLTFQDHSLPLEVVTVPLQFDSWGQITATPDLKYLKFQPELKYQVSLKLQVFCNRNRNDDIFRIPTTLTLGPITKTSHFILNCDARYLYQQNNRLVPYNLRFWVSPIFSNLNKNVRIDVPFLQADGRELTRLLRGTSSVSITGSPPVDDQNSYLEFLVQWDGYRYYLQKYPIVLFLYGVSVFWSFAATVSMFVAMVVVLRQKARHRPGPGFEWSRGSSPSSSSQGESVGVKIETDYVRQDLLKEDILDFDTIKVKREPDE